MSELWTKKRCRICGKEYFFGDGPQCKCPKERHLHEKEYAIEMKSPEFIEDAARRG